METGSTTTSTSQDPRNGLGISSLVLGIVGFVLGWVPILGLLAVACGATGFGLAMGSFAKIRKGLADNKTMTRFGASLSILATIWGIVGMVIVNNALSSL